jgi:hypothetical protein
MMNITTEAPLIGDHEQTKSNRHGKKLIFGALILSSSALIL